MRTHTFREWLIDRIATTSYVHRVLTDEQVTKLADEMGVAEDVLLEARVRYKLLRAQAGRQPPLGDKKSGTRHKQITIEMPPEVYEAWKEEVAARGFLDDTALLRSVLHSYLLTSREPSKISRQWHFEGRVLSAKHHSQRCRPLITQGAHRALRIRAAKAGCRPYAILRGLVLDVIDGHYQGVPLIDAERMYDDEKRYNLGAS